MNRIVSALGLSIALFAGSSAALAQAVVGQPAPAFTATDIGGKSVSLSDYKGKYVVLEWVNPGCPFVKKHYDSGNIPATQKAATAKGAVWLAVSSTATDAKDFKSAADFSAWQTSKQSAPTATLFDNDGKLGRTYGAKTTPHLYIVDPQGKLIYAGAIDSKPTSDKADIKDATNYVTQALAEAQAGKPVSKAVTQPYGCSVKYSNAG